MPLASEPPVAVTPEASGVIPEQAPTASTARPDAQLFASAEEVVRALTTELSPAVDAASLDRFAKRAAGAAGVEKFEADQTRLSLTFEPALPAKKVGELLGLKDVYVVSGDVHQRSWRLAIRTGDVFDPHNQRIATELPTIGPWRVMARVSERPPGPLPNLVAGASPAYSVTDAVFISRIDVEPAL